MSAPVSKPRRAKPGASWRVLAQGPGAAKFEAHSAGNVRASAKAYRRLGLACPPVDTVAEFDELVVDSWLHLERMNARSWWMQLGPLYVWIDLKPNGDVDVSIGDRQYDDIGGRVDISPRASTGGKRVPPASERGCLRTRKDGTTQRVKGRTGWRP